MKDNYGDRVEVSVDRDEISMSVTDSLSGADEAIHVYTPARARKLAGKLLAAAAEVEGATPAREVSSVTASCGEVSAATGDATFVYTLTLTEDQAKTLAVILDRIGGTWGAMPGHPTTARKYANEIADQLPRFEGLDGDPRFLVDEDERRGAIFFVGVAE